MTGLSLFMSVVTIPRRSWRYNNNNNYYYYYILLSVDRSACIAMLSDGDEVDVRQRWTSSLMNLHSSSSASSAAGHSVYDHAAYQPSMTAYADCSRPIPDLTGYTSATAAFGGYRYMAEGSRYNILSSTAGGPQASADRFRLQHADLWRESISNCVGSGTSCLIPHGDVV